MLHRRRIALTRGERANLEQFSSCRISLRAVVHSMQQCIRPIVGIKAAGSVEERVEFLFGYNDQATPSIKLGACRILITKPSLAFLVVWRVAIEGIFLDDSFLLNLGTFAYAHAIGCEELCQSPLILVIVVVTSSFDRSECSK